MKNYVCRICGSADVESFVVREMMYGFRDEFTYYECSKCGALQIAKIPKNLKKYYPKTYYSFNLRRTFPRHFLRCRLAKYLIWKKDLLGRLLSWYFWDSKLASIGMVELLNVNSKILDVGCGGGELLLTLKGIGFRHLIGIDPYIPNEIKFDDNFKILKKSIYELPNNKKFDLIMFHHSLEHIPDQLETLKKAKNLLEANGAIIVRMPIKSEYIWRTYGTNWVQIDAPRHCVIHTLKSFHILAEKIGFKIRRVVFDSTSFQFWGSELYKLNVPLKIGEKCLKKYFSKKQLKKWAEMARRLNREQQGDQAIFILGI